MLSMMTGLVFQNHYLFRIACCDIVFNDDGSDDYVDGDDGDDDDGDDDVDDDNGDGDGDDGDDYKAADANLALAVLNQLPNLWSSSGTAKEVGR